MKTASRPNPLPSRRRVPRVRVTRCTASEKLLRYSRTASSGSVVANDPLNRSDPTGMESPCITAGTNCVDPNVTPGQAAERTLVTAAVIVDILDTPVSPGPDATIVVVGVRETAKHPGFFTRLWNGIKSLFGGGRRAEEVGQAERLPKPGTGPGTVPRAERDPKRSFSPSERAAQRKLRVENAATDVGGILMLQTQRGIISKDMPMVALQTHQITLKSAQLAIETFTRRGDLCRTS